MRVSIATIVLATLGISDVAANPIELRISGIGRASCATWLSSKDTEFEGSAWILGFWSGSNYSLSFSNQNGDVGATTDAQGIIGEMKKRCQANPSGILAVEAGLMFLEFQKEGR